MCSLVQPRSPSNADDPLIEECRPLVNLLRHLLFDFGRTGGGNPALDRGGPRPERWEDDEYLYFESVAADGVECDIDISVHDGKVLIRIER